MIFSSEIFQMWKSIRPTYDSDVYRRIGVLTKEDKTLTGLIDYELYTPDELRPYFDKAFEEHIMPAIHYGKSCILKEADYYYHLFADDEWEEFLEKLKRRLGKNTKMGNGWEDCIWRRKTESKTTRKCRYTEDNTTSDIYRQEGDLWNHLSGVWRTKCNRDRV